MGNLVFFGDSFVSIHKGGSHVWPYLLADNLKIPRSEILNYGLPGTSLEWSIFQFIKYINSKNYSESDIIVFQTTSTGRPPIMPECDPSYAGSFGRYLAGDTISSEASRYYKRYESFYHTWLDMQNHDSKYKDRWLLYFTLKQIPNFTVLISAFSTLFIGDDNNNPLIGNTNNFIKIDADLISICTKEVMGNKGYPEFTKYFKGETRSCHLSNSNNVILAEQLSKCISEKSASHFNPSKYLTDIFDLDPKYEDIFLKEFSPTVYKKK